MDLGAMTGPRKDEPFRVPRRNRVLGEVKELTAEDWAHVWIAYQGFLAQVNLIVQRARDREQQASCAS
jgi:hypothetical protein